MTLVKKIYKYDYRSPKDIFLSERNTFGKQSWHFHGKISFLAMRSFDFLRYRLLALSTYMSGEPIFSFISRLGISQSNFKAVFGQSCWMSLHNSSDTPRPAMANENIQSHWDVLDFMSGNWGRPADQRPETNWEAAATKVHWAWVRYVDKAPSPRQTPCRYLFERKAMSRYGLSSHSRHNHDEGSESKEAGRFTDRPSPVKYFLHVAYYATAVGGVQGSWCKP